MYRWRQDGRFAYLPRLDYSDLNVIEVQELALNRTRHRVVRSARKAGLVVSEGGRLKCEEDIFQPSRCHLDPSQSTEPAGGTVRAPDRRIQRSDADSTERLRRRSTRKSAAVPGRELACMAWEGSVSAQTTHTHPFSATPSCLDPHGPTGRRRPLCSNRAEANHPGAERNGLTAIPAKPHTLTIVANADRIARTFEI